MISVIIPAFRERLRIPQTLREIAVFMRKHDGIISEVIVVDDGSGDGTAGAVLSMTEEIPSLLLKVLPVNSGKWAAIHAGMRAAKSDALLLLDADGSAPIQTLEDIGIERVYELVDRKVSVFGSRFMKGASVEGKSIVRNIVSRGYRLYSRMMYWFASGKIDCDDLQCPFKLVFKSQSIDDMCVDRWAGDIELACLIQGRIKNVPVKFIHKAGGSVKVGTALHMFSETMSIAWEFWKFRKGYSSRYG